MPLPSGQEQCNRTTLAIRTQMDLGRKATAATSHGFLLALVRSSRMLVDPDARTIDEMHRPVKRTRAVSLWEQRGKHPLPDPRLAPAVEAIGRRFPGTIAFRQISPGDARFREPQHPVEDSPVIVVGPAWTSGPHWRQQGLDPSPLVIGEFMAVHVRQSIPLRDAP